MPLYYLISGLLFVLVFFSVVIRVAKLTEGDSGIPNYVPYSKREIYVRCAKELFFLSLYLILFTAPMFANAPNWGKLLLAPVLIWLAVQALPEIWDAAKTFREKPRYALFLTMLEVILLGLVVTATKIVYL